MNGYINLIVFILTTMLYFYKLKPDVTVDTLANLPQPLNGLVKYALIVLLTQFGLNVSAIVEKCGGSASQNIGIAALFTFLPWTLIFGIVLTVLIMFPGFKSAFSDVIGYFYISSKAHKLFSEMLAIKKDIATKIEGESSAEQPALTSTADALIKLFGNVGVLINQIVPSNFNDYWQLLQPLMKTSLETQESYLEYIASEKKKKEKELMTGGGITSTAAAVVASMATSATSATSATNPVSTEPIDASEFYKKELLKLVVSRDNVGEFMWYLYTGILVISIIQYYILSRGCFSDASTMEKNYQKFLENEDKQDKQEVAQKTTYTITS